MIDGDIKLVSFNLCPFVQRTIILLQYFEVNYELINIDLKNKPEWFNNISPLGKVPLLSINNKSFLFESSTINEYINEVYDGDLLPNDPLEKAKMRSWVAFSGDLLGGLFQLLSAKNQESFKECMDMFLKKMSHLEKYISGQKYFNGNNLSLVDAAFAPALHRMQIIEHYTKAPVCSAFPKVSNWTNITMGQDYFINSIPENFEDNFVKHIYNKGSYLTKS